MNKHNGFCGNLSDSLLSWSFSTLIEYGFRGGRTDGKNGTDLRQCSEQGRWVAKDLLIDVFAFSAREKSHQKSRRPEWNAPFFAEGQVIWQEVFVDAFGSFLLQETCTLLQENASLGDYSVIVIWDNAGSVGLVTKGFLMLCMENVAVQNNEATGAQKPVLTLTINSNSTSAFSSTLMEFITPGQTQWSMKTPFPVSEFPVCFQQSFQGQFIHMVLFQWTKPLTCGPSWLPRLRCGICPWCFPWIPDPCPLFVDTGALESISLSFCSSRQLLVFQRLHMQDASLFPNGFFLGNSIQPSCANNFYQCLMLSKKGVFYETR